MATEHRFTFTLVLPDRDEEPRSVGGIAFRCQACGLVVNHGHLIDHASACASVWGMRSTHADALGWGRPPDRSFSSEVVEELVDAGLEKPTAERVVRRLFDDGWGPR